MVRENSSTWHSFLACTCIRGCCWNMRGRENIPRQRHTKKMCNLEADFRTRHTNTGGGAKLYIPNVSCAASCHLTTETGMLTTLMMQSRGQFVVRSGRGGAGEIVSFVHQACGRRPFVFSIAWRCQHARSKTVRAPRAMQTTASPALVRPRAARGAVAGNNSEDSGTRCHGEMGRSGHCWRPEIVTCSTPSRVWTVPYVLRLL